MEQKKGEGFPAAEIMGCLEHAIQTILEVWLKGPLHPRILHTPPSMSSRGENTVAGVHPSPDAVRRLLTLPERFIWVGNIENPYDQEVW